MLNQGMRPEEVTCLRKDDVDLERGQLSDSERKIYSSPANFGSD